MSGLPEHVLLTGATGFLGRNLARRLVDRGVNVTGWTRGGGVDTPSVRLEAVDLSSAEEVSAAMRGRHFDAVVHLATAGRMLDSFAQALTEAALLANLLEQQGEGRVGRVVAFGSADQYGALPAPQSEDSPREPVNLYGVAKNLVSELMRFARAEGRDAVLLRPFSVYGPGQPAHMLIAQAVRACLLGDDFHMGEGTQIRDFVFVDDISAAVERVLDADGVASGEYNLGTGQGRTVIEAVQHVLNLTGSRTRVLRGTRRRSGDPPALVADVGRARRELGWTADVSFTDGLERVITAEAARAG